MLPSRWLGFGIPILLFFSPSLLQGCDSVVGADPSGLASESAASIDSDVLRHTHLLDRARTTPFGAGKTAGESSLNLVLGLAAYEPDGITPRIVNKFDVTNRLLNKFGDGIAIKAELGGVLDALTLTLDESQLDSLIALIHQDPDLAWIEPDLLLEGEPPTGSAARTKRQQTVPWSVSRVGVSIWPASTAFSNLRVYVVDTGVNPIKDLNLVESLDFTPYLELRVPGVDVFEGIREMNPQRDRPDSLGHGTHIAGIIGARNNDGGIVGLVPGVPIHSIKVMNSNGVTDMTVLLKAVEHILNEKSAHPELDIVVNMSLGADLETTEWNALDAAIQKSIESGIVYVAAAGNDGRDMATYSPAHVGDVIAVGAYDSADGFAPYSNFGSGIDFLAPGTDVLSLSAFGSDVLMFSTGTSMAAPHVTALAARYLALNPGGKPADVLSHLTGTARTGILNVPDGTTGAAAASK
jgi:subtilisin family serine protease